MNQIENTCFQSFIPGRKRKPGTAGYNAKEIRDRKRKRLERQKQQQQQQQCNDNSISCVVQQQQEQHYHSSPSFNDSNDHQQHDDDFESVKDTQQLQRTQLDDRFQQEHENVIEKRYQIQQDREQMETRRHELTVALEKEKALIQMEETNYKALESDVVHLQHTLQQITTKHHEMEQRKQKKLIQLMDLQKDVEQMKQESIQLEQIQTDFRKEMEEQKMKLLKQRNTFAQTIQKVNTNIQQLRETIQSLQECYQKETNAHTTTLSIANRTLNSGIDKLNRILMSSNSFQRPKSELKTVFWSPNREKIMEEKEGIEQSIRSSHHIDTVSPTIAEENSHHGVHMNDSPVGRTRLDSSTPIQGDTTPISRKQNSRKASWMDLYSKVDSLSYLSDTLSVDQRKSSSSSSNIIMKRNKTKHRNKQFIKAVWQRTDSLAGHSMEQQQQQQELGSSPQTFTYMGHEILRKHKKLSPLREKYNS